MMAAKCGLATLWAVAIAYLVAFAWTALNGSDWWVIWFASCVAAMVAIWVATNRYAQMGKDLDEKARDAKDDR